jgi:hypothetical protein
MTHIPCDTRSITWRNPHDRGVRGTFRPRGKIARYGDADADFFSNPEAFSTKAPLWSGRLLVGFNVGDQPTWTVDDLVRVVRQAREAQGHPPDSSFLIQRGIYTSSRTGSVVEEDGAQVIVLNLDDTPTAKFRSEMVELGEVIARKLDQELVIVELQRGGVSREVIGAAP